jgi:predicted nucleic acid-binding protein
VNYLVDANVLCEATRPRADVRVIAWLNTHDAELHVSVITLGEIDRGIQLLPKGRKRRALEEWFRELEASFEGRILPVDQPVMSEWARMYARCQKSGRMLSSFDSLLAATSTCHGLTLVTRNTSDFPTDLKLLDPWQS